MNKNAPIDTKVPVIDYGWKPEFVAKPAPGAVERDLTHTPLVLDMKNSLDEHFHWEIWPGESAERIPSRETGNPATDGYRGAWVNLVMPIFFPD